MATTMAERVGADESVPTVRRVGGLVTIIGAIGMLVGAVFNGVAGTNADAALESGDVAGFVAAAQAGRDVALVGLAVWIVAICVMCAGGMLLASSSRAGVARSVSVFAFTTGAGTAVMFFALWHGVILALVPAADAALEPVVHALLAAAVNADWVITVMILSVGGGFAVLSGRHDWTPTWLVRWAYLVFSVGAVALALLVVGDRAVAFIEVPIGIGMLIATGIVAIRSDA